MRTKEDLVENIENDKKALRHNVEAPFFVLSGNPAFVGRVSLFSIKILLLNGNQTVSKLSCDMKKILFKKGRQ